MRLKLIKPTAEYAGQVMKYRAAMLANGDTLDGCAGLEDTESFEEWADFDQRLKERYGEGYVPSHVYLAIRRTDNRLVGIIDYRSPLTPFLEEHGGHIGYSIHPAERQKGYATEMLSLMLPICKAAGETEVLLTCNKTNIGSQKVIQRNSGVLKDEIPGENNIITQRYLISLDD